MLRRFFGRFANIAKSLYGPSIEEQAKREVAKEYDISPRDLDIDVKHMNLPYIQRIKEAGGKVYREIGKVLGAYNPRMREIYLDLGLRIASLFNPHAFKTYLKTYIEELVHGAQHIKGKLDVRKNFSDYFENYENDATEIEAKRVADKLTNRILSKYGQNGSLSLY